MTVVARKNMGDEPDDALAMCDVPGCEWTREYRRTPVPNAQIFLDMHVQMGHTDDL